MPFSGMDTTMPPVEASLAALEDVLHRAAADLLISRNVLARGRAEIGSTNNSVERSIVADADRVVEHLRQADEALATIIEKLNNR